MKFQKEDIEKLDKLGISTLFDLALIVPYRYEDYTLSSRVEAGLFHTLNATIKSSSYHPKYMRISLFLERFNQDIKAIIFHPRKYHYDLFRVGSNLNLYGKVEYQYDSLQITQPKVISSDELEKIIPFYKTRLQSKSVRALIGRYITKENLLGAGLDRAKIKMLFDIHYPDSNFIKEFLKEGGFSRDHMLFLKYLEVLNYLQKLSTKKVEFEANRSFDNDISSFIESLPFKLTNDQNRVIEEIRGDLARKKAARRVIMGDVGSGKSVIIFATVMMIRDSRAVLMAPTTVLAKQLYSEAKRLLPSDLEIGLVTNRTKKSQDLSRFDFIIGTHALLYRELPKIDLVMVDEQHRFGTKQRAMIEKLASSGDKKPHYLQFSATPIPRTLSMIQSSIIDISTIKEMPFKKDIDTLIITRSDFSALLDHIKSEIEQKKQTIIVYPLVEESEVIDYQSIDEARGYWEKNFQNVYVTYGKDREKEEVIEKFRDDGDILLATTLIEVGVSLPRLSTIVLVAPERLGLATLHQLRGRVSRNGVKGYCYLFTKQPDNKRLKEFCKTINGFEIAELDLKYRESGDLLKGELQSGKHFKWFDPKSDLKILEYAKESLNI